MYAFKRIVSIGVITGVYCIKQWLENWCTMRCSFVDGGKIYINPI